MSLPDNISFYVTTPQDRKLSIESNDYATNTPEYLSWRRLHLSKSKLSNVAELASFMSGFSVVAVVELQIDEEEHDLLLLTAFVVTTSLLVATSMMVVMISTCILPQLTAVTKMSKCPSAEVSQSPHDSLIRFIDISWILSNTVCLFLFTLDLILVVWIQFTKHSKVASIAATCILIPVLVLIIIFGIVFYRKIVKFQYDIYSKKFEELEELQKQLSHMNREFIRGSIDIGVAGLGGFNPQFDHDNGNDNLAFQFQYQNPQEQVTMAIPQFVGGGYHNNSTPENHTTDDEISITRKSLSRQSSSTSAGGRSRKKSNVDNNYSSRVYNV